MAEETIPEPDSRGSAAWFLPQRLDGRGALVAGGTQGIGRAFAQALAALGATTVVCGRSGEAAEAAAAEIGRAAHATVHGLGADVTDEVQVTRLYDEAAGLAGTVDILVSAVGGVSRPYDSCDCSLAEWEDALRVNLTSAFLLSRAALPPMRERNWGRVIFIGSGSGRAPGRGGTAGYAAAKMGLIGLANSLVTAQARHQVTVNVIAPGGTRSERALRYWSHSGGEEAIARNTPLGRLARPEEIAAVVPFLASDLGAFTTGAIIDIQGGR